MVNIRSDNGSLTDSTRSYLNQYWLFTMMTSSNGNIFHDTGHLCGEFTVTGEFPTQRPVMRRFDVFFDLRLNKRWSKQSWGWWFEMPLHPLWRHCNSIPHNHYYHQRGPVHCIILSVTSYKKKSESTNQDMFEKYPLKLQPCLPGANKFT